MFRKTRQKILESKLDLIDLHLKLYRDMIESLSTIAHLLKNKRFSEAAAHIRKICELDDLLKKQIKLHMTHEVLPVFETGAKLSYSLEEVERNKDEVFEWLSEIKPIAKRLQKELIEYKKDPEVVYHDFHSLLEKICLDQSFTDFVNTLRFLVSEFGIHQLDESVDRLTSIFDNLGLHTIIKKSSKKLFGDGHYTSAIFEAYKALNNYVQKRSKRKDLDGKPLMTEVFRFEYDQATHQIRRRPLLQLNELHNRSDRDEQEGFMYLFMGSMLGIRNPKAHDIIVQKDPFRTLEHLSFASLLAKRVDEAKLNC